MKRITTLGLLASLVIPALHAAETRIWTSRKGSTLEAELIRFDDKNVTLLTKERKEMMLPLVDLSIADRQFLVENSQAPAKILIEGEVGQPEKQVKLDNGMFVKLKDSNLTFGTDSESDYELLQSEHFIVASAGDIRPQAVAETAERLWHGMAFQHMNFRRDWGDKRMLILLVEKPTVYAALGKWYVGKLKEQGQDDQASKVMALWDKASGRTIAMPPDMVEKHNIFPETPVLKVSAEQSQMFKKPMGPFQIHVISGALLDRQLGNISGYGVEGLFAVLTGHSYYKEISLAGKSETQLIDVGGSGNDMFSEKKGFEDGTSWARTLRSLVKKGDIKCSIEPMFTWKVETLKPERLVLIYSFSAYMQSTPARLASFAAMVRRIESSKQIPAPIEIAKLFGFETVAALEADWKLFITEGNFK